MNFTINDLKIIFTFVLPYCDQEAIKSLFDRYGYANDVITADLCCLAIDEYGVPFSQELGQIMSDAIHSVSFKSTVSGAVSADPSKSKTMRKMLSSSETVDLVGGIFDFLKSGVESTASIIDAIKTNPTLALAALANAQAQKDKEESQSALYWIVGIGFFMIIIMVAIIVIALKKK